MGIPSIWDGVRTWLGFVAWHWQSIYPNSNQWRKVRWWHVYRMLRRQRWRRWRWDNETIGGEYDGKWEYATDEQCARLHLEATYGEAEQ